MEKTSPLTLWRRANGKTQKELGELLGVGDAAITKWEKGRVPAERVLEVERVTKIARHRIRPDLYPDDGGRRRSNTKKRKGEPAAA